MKKTLAWLLTLFMVLTVSTVTVFAAETDATGSIGPAYTSSADYWGEGSAKSSESFVVELYEGDVKIASATLNNIGGIIDGDVFVTWHIPFAGSNDEYWTVDWAAGYPKYDMNPDRVVLVSDGTVVATNNVQYNGPDGINQIVAAVADSNGKILSYATAADMQTAVAVDGAKTILMLRDVTLADALALPAGVTLNGNGKTINGTIAADGDLTFAGVTKVTDFSAGFYDRTITIGEGASLEITGSKRLTLGWGNTFNITGSITDAKTADKDNVQASLIVPGGVSITGSGATLNVTNAYIKLGSTTSKNSVANGTFNVNFTNSIADFTNNLCFYESSAESLAPVFNMTVEDSLLNVGTNLVLDHENCTTNIDNSIVTVESSLRNSGTLTLENGSDVTVKAMIQFSSGNAGNDGTIVVDNSELNIACTSEGHAIDGQGTGTLEVINGGEASIDYITKTDIEIDIDSKLTSKKLMDSCSVTVDAEGFNGGAVQVLNLETPLTDAVNVNVINSRIAALDAQGNVIVDENAVNALGGSGTEADPYTIGSVDDLTLFAELVNSGNDFAGKTVQLTADIDLAGIEWTPIGNNTKQFKGYFDGNNKTISNLTVTGNNRYVGLFGYIKGNSMSATATPSVMNLNLTGVNVSGDYYVGALAGQAYVCNITNVHVSGNVTGTRYVGGLVGHVYTYFKDCSFTGNASCTFDALGGIAGAGDCRAYDCKVVGDIIGSNWVGGIVGNGQEGTSAVGCYVKGTVSSDTNYYRGVGGIAGVAGHGYSSSVFQNNYFDGEVYLCGEKVDAIIMGIVNADNNDSIGTTVEGNSWNTEYYPATTPVYVVAEISSSTATAEEWIAGASEEKSDVRNNNLVMLESDLAYVDAEDANDVTIMQFSDVTEDEVAHAVIVNKSVASITDSNGVTTYYDTLAEAMAVVGAGNVVIELTDDATLSYPARSAFGAADTTSITINGNGHTLTLHQTDTDWSSIGMANANGKLVLNNMTINKTSAGGNNAWNNHAINFHCDVEMNNVTVNNSVAVHADAVLNNVDIVENGEYYGLWITADGQTVTMNGGSITATYGGRGIKIADQYVDAVESVTLNVTGTTFTTAKKAAILVTSTEGAAITVSNIDISGVAQDKTHAVWMDEDRGEHFDKVTVVGGNVLQEGEFACIVIKNDAILGYYKTLEAAFADASDDDTVVLLDNVNAAVTYAVNKTLTLDLNGYEIKSNADVVLTASAGELTIVDNSADKTGAIVSDGKTAIHSFAYVAIQSGKFVGTITTENGQIDDSQVCITGGTFTQNPDADLVEHSYTVLTNEDDTYTVVDTEYTLTIVNAGANASGAGIYIYGDIVTVYAGEMNGYFFGEWGSEDVDVTGFTSDTVTFVMPDHDVTLTVYWSTHGPANPSTPVVLPGTLNFETNGGTPIDSISRVAGTKVDLSQFVTVREGYTFTGWYSDAALTKPVTAITVRSTKTVYAGWIQNAVTPDIPVVVMPFTDVAADAYYYNAVLWAVNTGITTGMTDTMFGPDLVCTRAQVVTFLWRAAGCPVATNNDMPFADVSRNMYYYDAVLWAVEMGITNGISDTEFAPDAECSRAQIVTFLWRALGAPDAAADAGFVDVDADAYYATAVEWAVDNGITNGMGDNTFGADADCTRGQTVTFLFRFFCK